MLVIVMRIAVAAILIFAIVSKVNSAPAILRGESILANPQILYGTIAIESAVTTWAVFATSLWAWRVITFFFISLTIVAAWAAWTQEECSCFGNHLPTGASIPINIAVVAAMMLSRNSWGAVPFACNDSPSDLPATSEALWSHSLSRPTTSLIGVFMVSVIAATISSVALQRVINQQETRPSLRFLLATDWVGKAWPIRGNFHRDLSQLSSDKWLALVLRSDCDHCKELVKQIAAESTNGNNLKLVSFVAGGQSWPIHLGRASTDQLSSTVITWTGEEPFVASPAAFLIEDGFVLDAQDGEKAAKFVNDIIASGALRRDPIAP